MAEAFKYTSDGRKVAVLGKLNATQYIVQEVFIINEQEVPSGDNFVADGLHDAPAESHKEKRLRELEERASKTERDCELRIKEASARMATAAQKAQIRADALFDFAANSDNEQLSLLRAWWSGEITHVFIEGPSPAIVPFDDNQVFADDGIMRHHPRYEALKLVSLFGSTKGQLSFQLYRYSDGSGGSTSIYPARSYDDALAHAQSVLDAQSAAYLSGARNYFNPELWEKIDGIVIPTAAAEKYREAAISARQGRIEKLRQELLELEQEAAQ